MGDMLIIAGSWGESVAKCLVGQGHECGEVRLSQFANGEQRVQLQSDVKGKECVVVQSLVEEPDEALVQLLLLIDACKENGAGKVIAFIPYMGYSLMNRHIEGEPVSARAVARAISAAGPDEVWLYDLHMELIGDFFSVPTTLLSPVKSFHEWLKQQKHDDVLILAPDDGAGGRAKELAECMGVDHVVVTKVRDEQTTEVTSLDFGDADFCGKTVVIIDDMVNTGKTIVRVGQVLKEVGAKRVIFMASHFLGVAGSKEILLEAVDLFVTTNSIDHGLDREDRVVVLPIRT